MGKKSFIAEFYKVVALAVVRKLARAERRTLRHAKKTTLLSGISKDKRKYAAAVIDEFVRDGLLARHPTAHGMTYELTHRGAEEFLPVLREYRAKKGF